MGHGREELEWLAVATSAPAQHLPVDGESRTSLPGVFAGGDATDGEGTIVASVGRGKAAAHAMFRHVQGARNGGAATSAHAR